MRIELERIGEPYHFEARNETGNSVSMDAFPAIGGQGLGARPMELLLMGLAGCAGIDVISILNKQRQKFGDFRITVEGERETGKEANVFKEIHIHFNVSGEVEPEKLEHAIQLSLEKYCSVAKTLEKTAEITHSFSLNK